MAKEDQADEWRDEMNLAEMPITLLGERVPVGVNSVAYEGSHGKLTIRGADGLGLPTAPDGDVILGLMELTRLQNNFTSDTVPFTRYELLKLIGRNPSDTRSINRVTDSLNRWVGVTLVYEKGFYDARVKERIDATLHILDSVVMIDLETRRKIQKKGMSPPPSTFRWGKEFFASFMSGNIKRLDMGVYFSIGSAIGRQMYRHLDKRFHSRDTVTYDLNDFAFGHIGISPLPDAGQVKRQLARGFKELEEAGIINPPAYQKPSAKGKGWTVTIRRAGKKRPDEPSPAPHGRQMFLSEIADMLAPSERPRKRRRPQR